MYAANFPLDEISSILTRVFTLHNWVTDFTFPMMSYLSGKGVKNTILSIFGPEVDIRDLLYPMFAVSTNLETHAQEVHRGGPLWYVVDS